MNDKNELIAQFGQKTILVVGDVMVDSYQIGRVDRISPEAPVPIVLLQEIENRLGGAANVALNVNSLGGEAILCSVIGDDDNGELFKSVLTEAQLSVSGIISSKERKTTIKSRIFASGQQLLRMDDEDSHYLSQDEETVFLEQILGVLEQTDVDVILFQDYNKGVLTEYVIKKLIEYAQTNEIQTVVDPKWTNFFSYKGVTLFKPNLKEISEAMGREIEPIKEDLDLATSELQARMSCEYIFVTLSEKGLYVKGVDSFLMPTTTQAVADVSGAGDTVISVIALGMACGAEMYDIAQLSNKAAGIVCSKLGVVPILKSELEK